jgi:hypothetical protein
MPYTKTTWTDEIPASTPVKYKVTDDVLGIVASSAKIEVVTSVTLQPRERMIHRRQGGSSTSWTTSGTTSYTPTNAIIQVGARNFGVATASGSLFYGTVAITFPQAFAEIPIVIPSVENSGFHLTNLSVYNVSKTGFTMLIVSQINTSYNTFWMAVGEA